MDERYVCPICGLTLHNCVHSIEAMIKFNNEQIATLRAQLDRNEIVIKGHIARESHLQEQLDVAMKAMKAIRPVIGRADVTKIIDDAEAEIAKLGGEK